MRVPRIDVMGHFMLRNQKSNSKFKELPLPPLEYKTDTVTFSSSTAFYLKKYNTLPDEIKRILNPKDAIDMFRDMEMVQKGMTKRRKVAQGNQTKIYENPWLDDYYFLISQDPEKTTQIVYTRQELGNCVWSDKDNNLIQIIKKADSK